MIRRLRNRFIRIAMLSVTAVMLLLTVILNVANYVSTDSDLKQTLTLIYENAGTIPHSRFLPPSGSDSADAPTPPENDGSLSDIAPPDAQDVQAPPDDKVARREGPFTAETPFSTRFFVLRYTSDGTLTQESLDNIASVTAEDTQEYLSAALAHGAGYGYCGSYRFFVAQTARTSPSSSTAITSCARCAWCSCGRCSPMRHASCLFFCSLCCSRAGPSTQWFAARSSRSSSSPTQATN